MAIFDLANIDYINEAGYFAPFVCEDEGNPKNKVFLLLWKEYCDLEYESSSFTIFGQPIMKPVSKLECRFEFADMDDFNANLSNTKDAMQLWSHYYIHLDKEKLAEKYIPHVNKFFERNDITKYGCLCTTHVRPLASNMMKENFELPIEEFNHPLDISDKIKYMPDNQHFVAVDEINEDESIMIEVPMVLCVPLSCQCNNSVYNQCFFCRAPIIHSYNCPTCWVAVFCSISCREASEVYHKWECKAVKTHFFKCNDVSLIAFRMLMIGASCNFRGEHYLKFNTLPANVEAFSLKQKKQLVRKTLQILLYLINHTKFYKWMAKKSILTDIRATETKNIYLGSIYLRHLMQAITNVVYFPVEDYSLFFQTKGAVFSAPAIVPFVIKLKQDCQPNSKLVFKRNYCIVRALRNINKGETITVNFYQTDECEVHNTKKMFFNEHKRACTCRICRQPYNQAYGEVLLRCKLCTGIAGKIGEKWQCFQCQKSLNLTYMESRKKLMESKYISLQKGNFNDLHTMIEFLQEYPTIYCDLSKQYLEVVAQSCKRLLYECNYSKLMRMVNEITELINIRYHKYSFLKLHFFKKIISCILSYIRLVTPTSRLASLLYQCLKEIEEISYFHCLSSEWEMLHKVVWNVGFIALKPSKEDVARLMSITENIHTEEDQFIVERAYTQRLEETKKMLTQPDISPEELGELDCCLIPFWTNIVYDILPPDEPEPNQTQIIYD